MADISQIEIPSGNSTTIYNIKDATARTNMQSTDINYALYHLGFYLDENGGLCEKNER